MDILDNLSGGSKLFKDKRFKKKSKKYMKGMSLEIDNTWSS